AGTRPRGKTREDDDRLAAELRVDPKECAEHLMLIDLGRNDVGRVAEVGSVRVPELFRVERYPTVFQLTSTVEGTLRDDATLEDVFAALFPCGSVTGAPKVSTTRIIAGLEDAPRGVYCGAVGFVAPGGRAAFNVAIRTVVVDAERGEAEYGTGGGVTWDSTAEREYAEALDKARLLAEEAGDFELLETLRLEGGEYALLEEHVARLAESAAYFDFRLSPRRVREALAAHALSCAAGARRVRLLVSRDGGVRVESTEIDGRLRVESAGIEEPPAGLRPSAKALTVALARTPVSRGDRFLYHKTTRRTLYEERRAERPGAFDVLLWNEEGELTEFTNGNLVVELGGRRWTPPRECGLLAGTFRARLLRRGEVAECVLRREDLARVARCWLINSVRGWVEVEFAETESTETEAAGKGTAAAGR
ncbi:MAG TPA: chorismate-binding protein, partial [Pyrinomonadaceae bacterium]|nr:chorismate-binding protein [Pyrinomonadaceae bacterium]